MDTLLFTHLLLSSSQDELLQDPNLSFLHNELPFKYVSSILNGDAFSVLQDLLSEIELPNDGINESNLLATLNSLVGQVITKDQNLGLFLGIASLQVFIQNNYTGPSSPLDSLDILFGNKLNGSDKKLVSNCLTRILTIEGQSAYELMDDSALIIIALLTFEQLTNQPTLLGDSVESDIQLPDIEQASKNPILLFAHWWRARALLTHLSLIHEATGHQPVIASSILNTFELPNSISSLLPTNVSEEFKKKIFIVYYLENVKCSLAINTEHLALPSLTKVKKLTNFKFVLTGARAKRTKFQQVAHSSLIILAKSSEYIGQIDKNGNSLPEEFSLDSELLLEKPHFESIGSEPLDQQIVKKQKLNEDDESGFDEDRILPVALRQENIPKELQALDANDQPKLSDYDDIQLLLRLYTIRGTSPAKNPLVEEELSALISRILYSNGTKNWTIFSRTLWERSIIETTKAKTIERGLLQMQSLVEELGLKIQTRLIPENKDSTQTSAGVRMKYIHQLPFIPRWNLDARLAEKFMSLGVLKSAVEIYERLQMSCDAALCYAAVGDEKQAEEILVKRIEENPNDARAYSILGDIRQDPALWEKSWAVGKYINAKNSLGRYYYNPPPNSGLTRDYDAALKHLNDSLRRYTLNYDTWYFYGCIGLECNKMELAAEAFSRCVALDDTTATAWSNLSAAYVELGKMKEAFSCLKRAAHTDSQKNWRIWENYMIVAFKLQEWDDVLLACKQLVNINRDRVGEKAIDLPVIEKLVELLVSSPYPSNGDESTLNYFQKNCIEFVCVTLPSLITNSDRCWRLVAKVELWRKRPWASLDCHEKAYRAISHNPDLEINEKIWDETVDACDDLVAAYESLGEMTGRHGEGNLVCKDWKYKARSTIKALMSRGKATWDGSEGWERLLEMRSQL